MALKGGSKLNAALAGIASKLGRNPKVRAGFLAGATYPDGTSVPMVAAIQNFGAPAKGILPRPFFSNVIAEDGPKWPEQLGRILVYTDYNADTALNQMGELMVGQIEQSIVDMNAPPLAPATVERRTAKARKAGRKINAATASKPLVDTGHMLGSVKKEVTGL